MLLIAAGLLLAALRLPLWQMRMEAPQYRDEEALDVAVFASEMRGDLGELKTLNQYIGVHVPERLPQFTWIPAALIAGATLAFVAALFSPNVRRAALFAVPILLSACLGFAAFQAKEQMHDIGHYRDAKTVMLGVKDFTPPFIGYARIAQFDIHSSFGLGAYLVAAAVMLQLASATAARKSEVQPRPDNLRSIRPVDFRKEVAA